MLQKLLMSVIVGIIAIGLIKYLVPFLAGFAGAATFIVALIAIIVIIGIIANYRPWTL